MRIAVIAPAFMIALRRARLAVEERDEALVGVEPERGVAGGDADRLQRRRRRRRRRGSAGISPISVRLARRADDEAERVEELGARERGERRRHRLDALAHRQQPAHVVLAEDPDAHRKNEPMRSRSASESGSSSARSTGSRCSGRLGPQTAPVTSGCESTQANASVAMSVPRERASAASAVEPVEDALGDVVLVGAGPERHPRPGRERLAAAVAAGEPAAGERAEGDVGDPVLGDRAAGRRASSPRSSSE